MLSKKIKAALEGSSAIRAMFVEGKEQAGKDPRRGECI